MSEETVHARPQRLTEPRRLESFSDAAFSIVITLLVLEIHRPAATVGRLGQELVNGWSSYVAYAVYAWTSQGLNVAWAEAR